MPDEEEEEEEEEDEEETEEEDDEEEDIGARRMRSGARRGTMCVCTSCGFKTHKQKVNKI